MAEIESDEVDDIMIDKVKRFAANIAIAGLSILTILALGAYLFKDETARTAAAPIVVVSTPTPIVLIPTAQAQTPETAMRGLTGGTITLRKSSEQRASELIEMFGCEWIIDELPSQESIDLWGLDFAAQSIATSMQLLIYQHGANSDGELTLVYVSDADAKQAILMCWDADPKQIAPKSVATPANVMAQAYTSEAEIEAAIRDAYKRAEVADDALRVAQKAYARAEARGDMSNEIILALSEAEDTAYAAWEAYGFTPPHHSSWDMWEVDEALINGFGCDMILFTYDAHGQSVSALESDMQALAARWAAVPEASVDEYDDSLSSEYDVGLAV